MPVPDTLVGSLVADAFRASGLKYPPKGVAFGTIHLHSALLASGDFVAIFPGQMLRFGTHLPPLKVLPVELPILPSPVGIMTLKRRTLRPVAQLFIERAREVAKPLAKRR
jgi:DNA-binding transcriptional LysR family regulator